MQLDGVERPSGGAAGRLRDGGGVFAGASASRSASGQSDREWRGGGSSRGRSGRALEESLGVVEGSDGDLGLRGGELETEVARQGIRSLQVEAGRIPRACRRASRCRPARPRRRAWGCGWLSASSMALR